MCIVFTVMRKFPTHYARVLSPSGIYPSDNIEFPDAVYVADDELSFSVHKVTTHTRGRDGEEESYSEVQWLNPAEVRLYGCLLLGIDVEYQYLAFYPHSNVEPLEDAPNDLSDREWLLEVVKPMLIRQLTAADHQVPGYPAPQKNAYQNSNIVLPPVVSGMEYDQRKDIDLELARQVYSSIQLDDDLYIRGLYTLIKGGMLVKHYEFLEEAIYSLFISMEVAFSLVRRALYSRGVKDPSSVDAMTYILEAFNETHRIEGKGVEKWFEEYYDRRIMSFHPDSRFGIVPHAPLYADDFSHLYRDMIEIFRYLICGYVHPRKFDDSLR